MVDDAVSPLLAHHQRTSQAPKGHLVGGGPERTSVAVWEGGEAVHGYPARPLSGLVMDMDTVLERCDFGTYKVSEDFALRHLEDPSVTRGSPAEFSLEEGNEWRRAAQPSEKHAMCNGSRNGNADTTVCSRLP